MNYRIGYIGFGSMAGHYHYETALRDDVPFTPAAVFDVREEQRTLARERGLAVFDNLKDFLDSRLFDFVLVATPNQFHCPYVCAALEAGYPVMSEKPVAMSSDEIRLMMATAKRTGKMFTVHHNRRWDRDLLIAKEALDSGRIGKPLVVENRVFSLKGNGQMFGWRMLADHGGGMLGDWGVHMLDQALYLFPQQIQSVYASVFPIRSGEVDDYAKIIIRFTDGLVMQVEDATFGPLPLPKWHILGEKGAIQVNDICGEAGKMRWVEKAHTEPETVLSYPNGVPTESVIEKYVIDEWQECELPFTEQPQDWASLYKNVGAALDGRESLIVTPESVLRCFEVIEAAFESAKTGKAVEF